MSERRVLMDIREALKRIEVLMTTNDDALAALTSAVADNTTATDAAVSALGSAGGSDDISAGVNAAAASVEANTASLTAATAPPAGTPVTNEAGTQLPPQ